MAKRKGVDRKDIYMAVEEMGLAIDQLSGAMRSADIEYIAKRGLKEKFPMTLNMAQAGKRYVASCARLARMMVKL